MAATEEKPASASDKGWLSTAWDYAAPVLAMTNPLTAALYTGNKISNSVVSGYASMKMGTSDNPAEYVLDKLGETERFSKGNGPQDLQKIREDKQFMAALNKAIQNDDTVRTGLAGMVTGSGGSLSIDTIGNMLADPTRRGVLTQVLDKAGQSGSDELNFAWMTDIADSAAKNDMGKVQTLLAKGGVQNDMVDMAADPTKIFGLALTDSKAFGEKMSGMMGLTGEQGKAFAQIFEFLAKFLQAIWGNVGDPNSFAHFFDKHGDGLKLAFNNTVGITDQENAAPKADNDNPRHRVPTAHNDNPDIKVADASRASANFNSAAGNRTPQVAAAAIEQAFPGSNYDPNRLAARSTASGASLG